MSSCFRNERNTAQQIQVVLALKLLADKLSLLKTNVFNNRLYAYETFVLTEI